MDIDYRFARLADVPALEVLISLSARALQRHVYTVEQLEGAIGTVFGVDTQLIKDGTYLVASSQGAIVGSGGWSRRRTLYGGDQMKQTEDPLRDPRTEPAMLRAFFVHPDFARKGIGRELVRLSEVAALSAGFSVIEVIATLSGEPLYEACGYVYVDRYAIDLRNGLRLEVVRMKRKETAT